MGEKTASPSISKTVKKEGTYGRKPSLGWKCNVELKIESKPNELQSDYLTGETAEITIGDGNWPVDKAIESCVEMMYENEESSFRIELPEPLEITIALKESQERKYVFEWSDEEKFEASKTYKSHGVDLYKENRIDQAFYKFSKALKMMILMDTENLKPEENELMTMLYNNLANCQYQFKNYEYATELCTKSLNIAPSVKAYFRRALSYIELKLYENAENDLLALLKIEPKNKAAMEKYKLVRELDKKNRENYVAIVRNMFR